MDLKVPYSLPEKKLTSKQSISDDEFKRIIQILNDNDLGAYGGKIDETAALEKLKERAKSKEIISNDVESNIFEEARNRCLDGNNNYAIKIYTVKKGDDLRKIAYNVYGNAENWILIAALNNIINPSSSKEIYPGRELIIV